MTAPAFRDLIVEHGFPRLLAEFESGRIAPEVFAARMMEMSGVRLSYEEFVRAWADIFWLNEAVAHLIASLKSSGYLIYLGSDTNLLHATHYRRQFARTLDLLDGFVLSHEVGHLKPVREFPGPSVAGPSMPCADARSSSFAADARSSAHAPDERASGLASARHFGHDVTEAYPTKLRQALY